MVKTLKTAVKTKAASPFAELLEKPVKLKDRTPEAPKPAGKAAGGKLSEPKSAGNTVFVAADSTQPGSGEIRRMVEAGEPLPTDLKGLVKVSDAIRAGASATEVRAYILSMGNKRKRQTLADGGSIHRRLKGTGYDGANRKGQFQKGRGKNKPGTKAESASPGSPQAGGTDYVSKKKSDASMKTPDELAAERGEAPAPRRTKAAAPVPAPTEPAKFKAGTKELSPAFGPKRGVAAPKAEKGGVGAVVGKSVGKAAVKIALKGGKQLLGKVPELIGNHPLGAAFLAASDGEAQEVARVVSAAKAGRWSSAISRAYAGAIPSGRLMNQLSDWLSAELNNQ